MSRSALTFNIHDGVIEALVQGYKNGLLRNEEYSNLAQCDTINDLKSQLQVTEYGNFLQNEGGAITSKNISEKATEKLVTEFLEVREWADQPLAKFLDFITYDAMIANVLKLIAASRHGRDSLEILYRCHPLGLFPGIGALTASTSVEEMFQTVLIDSPIGPFFENRTQRDFDEVSIEYLRAVLQRNYLEAFHEFCQNLGGETCEIMCPVLEFEADRLVLTITANTCGMKDMMVDDRRLLYPEIGQLVAMHDDLSKAESIDQIVERLKGSFQDYADMFSDRSSAIGGGGGDDAGKRGFERKLLERSVEVYRTAMMRQFQYGVFYGWVKLKELEVSNLVWISECIVQGMKSRVHEYLPLVSA